MAMLTRLNPCLSDLLIPTSFSLRIMLEHKDLASEPHWYSLPTEDRRGFSPRVIGSPEASNEASGMR